MDLTQPTTTPPPPPPDMGPCCTGITPALSLPLLLVASGGQDWSPIQICSLEGPPPVLTSGGSQSPNGRQAGRTHPMECFLFVSNNFWSDHKWMFNNSEMAIHFGFLSIFEATPCSSILIYISLIVTKL